MWQNWQRRTLLKGSLVLALGGLLPGSLKAALQPTPRQTEGPFYPVELPLDSDNDLLRVGDASALAEGTPLHLFGQVLAPDGSPVAGARVEIWQCDAAGVYRHPRAPQGGLYANFQGFGQTLTDEVGRYRFRTIRPAAYPGRTPHIHVKVIAPDGETLTTQMYVAGEPLNERDGLYRRLGEAAALVTVALEPAEELEAGALKGDFRIVLG